MNQRIFTMSFSSVYPLYVKKAEKKDTLGQKWMKSSAG